MAVDTPHGLHCLLPLVNRGNMRALIPLGDVPPVPSARPYMGFLQVMVL